MKRLFVAVLGIGLINGALVSASAAALDCPPELAEAKGSLSKVVAASKATRTAKMQEVQAPRSQAGSKMQDTQAPRIQDVQAPKVQDVQAPKMQDVQAPKMQDVQAPKGVQTPRITKARTLIRQSEQACKKGDMTVSAEKAKEALALLAK